MTQNRREARNTRLGLVLAIAGNTAGLGVDRDAEAAWPFDFDERDPGVLALIRQTVEGARRNHCHCGICGQPPSDYPEVAEYLVQLGIDSIILNPDSLLKTTLHVLQLEKMLGRK